MSLSNNRLKSTTVYGAFKILDNPGLLGIGSVPASFDISGNGIFRGIVDFSNNLPICSGTPVNGNQLITKSFADSTYIGSDVKITNNVWTGTNEFNTYLPTSTVTPTTGTQLITKTYADVTYTGSGILSSNNAWTGTNSFNSYAPSSSVTPSSGYDLCNKTYVDLKAPLASPAFTGTVTGIDKTMVGLSNVNNTSDANKPVSTAQQTALDLKANLASPALTGTPTAPTAAVATNTTQLATCAFVLANSGSSTFATDITVNTITVGLGGGNISTNTAVGYQAHLATATGGLNTALGYQANTANTSGNSNTAIGHSALKKNTVGNNNTACGHNSLFNLTGAGGTLNCAFGETSLYALTTGANNVGIGYQTMRAATTAISSTAIGHNAFQTGNYSNSTAIGYSAQPTANNQVVLGTASETVIIPGNMTISGTPTAPTASAGTNTTQLATTAFVATSFAPLDSPALTGTPTAPTATAGTNTTQIATTAFVLANPATSPSLNNNIKPYTNPIIAETVPRFSITTTVAYGVGRIVYVSIYLTSGLVITGLQSYVYYTVAGTSPTITAALFDSSGVLLRNSSAASVSATQTRIVQPFASTYTVSTAGTYTVGLLTGGTGVTFAFPSTAATLGNIYNNTLFNGGLGGPTNISCGQAAMTSIGNITGTSNASSSVYWYGLY